jgi:hypothetical protein
MSCMQEIRYISTTKMYRKLQPQQRVGIPLVLY